MLNKKLLIPLVGLCLAGLIFGTYKAGTMASTTSVATSQKSAATDPPPTLVTPPLTQSKDETQIPTPTPSETSASSQGKPSNQSPPSPPSDTNLDKINQLITDGKIIEAKDGTVYDVKKAIVIAKTFLVAVDGYRVNYNYAHSYQPNKYLVIVDFEILNLSNRDYYSTLSSFILTDSRSYTYRPTILYAGIGDITGTITSGKSKRGEVVFEVPVYDRSFELSFSPGKIIDNQNVAFSINTRSMMPEDIFKYEAHE